VKAKELMTSNPLVCGPETTVADAAQLMWKGDCGALPVVEAGKLVGIVTDRDMYIALATTNARAAQLTVGTVANLDVATCAPDDDVSAVLDTMIERRVRRVPVVGFGGLLVGIVSLNDIAVAAGPGRPISSEQVLAVLQAICTHHHPVPHVVAA
jgi:CBS domain-containing protein